MTLSREQILRSADLPHEEVEVPEWGGSVRVSRLSGLHRAELDDVLRGLLGEDKKFTGVTSLQYTLALIVRAVVDDEGQRIFSDEDVEGLRTKSDEALARVGEVAARLNGIGAKAQEEIKKTSAISDPKDDSILPSPEPLAA
jgi:hypothetical protein